MKVRRGKLDDIPGLVSLFREFWDTSKLSDNCVNDANNVRPVSDVAAIAIGIIAFLPLLTFVSLL